VRVQGERGATRTPPCALPLHYTNVGTNVGTNVDSIVLVGGGQEEEEDGKGWWKGAVLLCIYFNVAALRETVCARAIS